MQAVYGIYRVAAEGPRASLRQGEILSELIEARIDLSTLQAETLGLQLYSHPYALILTQDCDLDQDFKARLGLNKPDKLIPAVLFCEVFTAEELRGTGGITSDMWRRISQNKDERYHFLQKAEPSCDTVEKFPILDEL